jgi:glycosyltransferase involved in cell wall biosynthesis
LKVDTEGLEGPAVYMNARFLTQPLTGVQRYAYELAQQLPIAKFLTPGEPRPHYASLDPGRVLVRPSPLKGHFWEQWTLPRSLPKGALLWSPGSGPVSVSRQVLTIHDMAYLEGPQWYSRNFALLYRQLYARLAPRVRTILTVSEFSKRRIVELLGVPEGKVVVTPLAASPRFRPRPAGAVAEGLRELGVEPPYLLAVGAVSPRKNFDRLYEAWGRISGSFPDFRLVVVGKTGMAFSGASGESLPQGTERVHWIREVSDDRLIDLYNGAWAFVYPSLYEGFGLPALEAIACGTPVVTSEITSLPEVVGGAGILVDPYSVEAIADGMHRIIERPGLRDELSGKGLEQAGRFTWERTARLTWGALRRASEA